jgi:hypothetical protein
LLRIIGVGRQSRRALVPECSDSLTGKKTWVPVSLKGEAI